MKHIHAELIKAWADGAEIEARYLKASGWTKWKKEEGGFIWYDLGAEYRIKPEPKPDVIENLNFSFDKEKGLRYLPFSPPNLKLTFDGETGELKDAKVIK
jgi:hypothetical protein